MARFLEAAPSIKYKAALSVGYGAGLRVSEIALLKVTDIDSQRMMLRIEHGSHGQSIGRSPVARRADQCPGGGAPGRAAVCISFAGGAFSGRVDSLLGESSSRRVPQR
jgi:integrase